MDSVITGSCSEYAYSEEYLDFIVDYDYILQEVYDKFQPDCIQEINVNFLSVYKSIYDIREEVLWEYGYNSVPKCFGLLDESVLQATGVNRVRNLPGLSLTGRDVIVGFVDTGIDYTNRLFRKSDGTSRIISLWDQTDRTGNAGDDVVYVPYGTSFGRNDINRALENENPESIVPERDTDGHGTFLASIAVGGEYETEQFSGVAIDSDIIVVKLKPAKQILKDFYLINSEAVCFQENDIMSGVNYILEVANILKKPAVVCLGIGTNQGDHNGSGYLEKMLDLVGGIRGVCVVTAGGNEFGAGGHFESGRFDEITRPVPATTSSSIAPVTNTEVAEISVGSGDRGFTLEIWGKTQERLEVSIISPTGEVYDRIPSTRNGSVNHVFVYEGTEIYAENHVVERGAGNRLVWIRFKNPTEGIWSLALKNTSASIDQSATISAAVNIWLPIRQFLNSDTRFVQPSPNITICSPGNSVAPITVAGYNHITNSIYVNSSRGFTRSGRVKPDITAPAVNVEGAFAISRESGEPLFERRSGTSVASAITAGAAALIMEWGIFQGNEKDMNTELVKQYMIRGASRNINTNFPSREWGWGILDVYGVFDALR